MRIVMTKKLGKLLETTNGKKYINDALQASYFIVLREYKKQVPVDRGELRQNVTVKASLKDRGASYIVTTTATNRGKPYPIYIHEGTGDLKGQGDYGYTSGYTRAGTVAKGIGGIRPNKFATRTVEAKKDDVKNFMIKTLRPYM